jgi:iron complex transport system permease protein
VRTNYPRIAFITLFAVLALLICPTLGSVPISWVSFLHPFGTALSDTILWEIRVPRVSSAFVVGAGLSVSGMVFQSMFRNVLATPFTLGVSSGAAFGATLFFALGFSWSLWDTPGSSLFGIAGAIATTFIVFVLSSKTKEGVSTTVTLLLSGVVISFFFSSLILLLQYISDFTGIFRITRWLMGSLEMVTYKTLIFLSFPVFFSALVAWFFGNELNLLVTGDEVALSRGVSVDRVRKILVFSTSLAVGAIVSFCGPIGFVGIVVPHICRLLVGPNHRILTPSVFLFGGAFLALSDTLSRMLIAPYEIPVGVITSLLGGPFFLWLLLHHDTN